MQSPVWMQSYEFAWGIGNWYGDVGNKSGMYIDTNMWQEQQEKW